MKSVNQVENIACRLRAFSNHLLRVLPARSTLFEKLNALFSNKNSKNTCRLGGCSVLNALNLEK